MASLSAAQKNNKKGYCNGANYPSNPPRGTQQPGDAAYYTGRFSLCTAPYNQSFVTLDCLKFFPQWQQVQIRDSTVRRTADGWTVAATACRKQYGFKCRVTMRLDSGTHKTLIHTITQTSVRSLLSPPPSPEQRVRCFHTQPGRLRPWRARGCPISPPRAPA